jgi:hypothetical protein
MTSENELKTLETLQPLGSEETKEGDQNKVIQFAQNEVKNGFLKVQPQIDGMSSAGLKRVLKAMSHVGTAEHLITGRELHLKEEEKTLIDNLFLHMENTMALLQILNENNQGETNE